MKKDYGVSPLMIGAQSGLVWTYKDPVDVRSFSAAIPIRVSADNCDDTAICLWYTSPILPLNDPEDTRYALLGEPNKWTAVSQQRFKSIENDVQKQQTVITVEGVKGEVIPVHIFHSTLQVVQVNCTITSANDQANIVITASKVVCS